MLGYRRRIGLGGMLAALLLAACGDVGEPAGPEPVRDDPSAPAITARVREAARPLTGAPADYDPLLAVTAGAGFVLLGESTHGTREFYQERARISRRLIDEQGVTAVVVETEWVPAERVNLYISGAGPDASAAEALSSFRSFPRWMWRNTEVRAFVEALRQRNAGAAPERRVAFYGMDVQEIFETADAVVASLERVDPAAAARARERYACFDRFGGDPSRYAIQAQNPSSSCEQPALAQLREMEERYQAASPADPAAFDSAFAVLRKARSVKYAEEYFRTQLRYGPHSWNFRDTHMAETVEAIAAHQRRKGQTGKVVVWAHNTHVGDFSATSNAETGQINLGQILRERHGAGVVLVGFTTYTGTVTAAASWGAAGRQQPLRPALKGSYSDLFHDAGAGSFVLLLRGDAAWQTAFGPGRLQRAVGVIYLPETERQSHYFTARIAEQFDAVVHVEQSTALHEL